MPGVASFKIHQLDSFRSSTVSYQTQQVRDLLSKLYRIVTFVDFIHQLVVI